ncbi:hypothetical protein [Nitrospirillum iridis]|uniref:Uncharacterized protein n=1 Tax=Nitrospirillum iridis TaxID=765888 RepID=A0A7X0B3F6_9PROT|nr:hypothetical protein [Nitrospirillum iridis]MBB6253524.1 hypothetical protein [Nitrospirillum iridis]
MNSRPVLSAVLIAGFLQAAPATAVPNAVMSTTGWKTYLNAAGFQARYPGDWVRWNEEGKDLFLTSTHERLEAVVIAHGEAEITLGELHPPVPGNPRSDYKDGVSWDEMMGDTVIPREAGAPDACGDIERLAVRVEIGPRTFQDSIILLCAIRGWSFQTVLTYWRDEGIKPGWEATALEMMRSLRLP